MRQRILSALYRAFPDLHRDLMIVSMPVHYSKHDDLSPLEIMILLLEDRRYFQHRGIDWRSCVRETVKLCTLQKYGGASTIDMQFVRTRTGYKDKTIKRKLYEMLLARLLQSRMSKIAILRGYLNIVYLGSGISGVETASQKVFDKDPYDLTLYEMSNVAAMMVYPRPRTPTSAWQKKVERRAQYGLNLYRKLGNRYTRRPISDQGDAL